MILLLLAHYTDQIQNWPDMHKLKATNLITDTMLDLELVPCMKWPRRMLQLSDHIQALQQRVDQHYKNLDLMEE